VIKFRCPQGHPLAASESQVGKAGQCPRCQARFIVPPLDVQPAHDVTSSGHEQAASTADPDQEPQPDADKFMFLCPNGHKLVGSVSHRGRPGQCPHCNSRFLIPDLAGESDPDSVADEPLLGLGDIALGDVPFEDIAWDVPADAAMLPADTSAASSGIGTEREQQPQRPVPVSCHPLAQIIRKMWTGPLELRLQDGSTLVVESFSAELSQHEYGVFAVRGDEGSTDIVVIPWDQITRLTLPHVGTLPADLGS